MVARNKAAGKGHEVRVEAVLITRSSMKRLGKGCMTTCREKEGSEVSIRPTPDRTL